MECHLYVNSQVYTCDYQGTKDTTIFDAQGNSHTTVGNGFIILSDNFPHVRIKEVYTNKNNPVREDEEYVDRYIPNVKYADII